MLFHIFFLYYCTRLLEVRIVASSNFESHTLSHLFLSLYVCVWKKGTEKMIQSLLSFLDSVHAVYKFRIISYIEQTGFQYVHLENE